MSSDTIPQFLSEIDCRALIAEIIRLTNGRGFTRVDVQSQWGCSARWARNRASVTAESRDTQLVIERSSTDGGGAAKVRLNQIDSASLSAAVQWVEAMWRLAPGDLESAQFSYAPPDLIYPKTAIWSDATYAMQNDERSAIANRIIAGAEQAGMLSAGYFNAGAGSEQLLLPDGRMLYARYTTAECSLTVRDPKGTGSGWAGASSYDWSRIDAAKLADIALDKCLRSRNPVRIEPGRYTVIMEPQATYELLCQLMRGRVRYMESEWEEVELPFKIQRPFHDGHRSEPVSRWAQPMDVGVTKIGQQLFDPRMTVTFDPGDPEQGGIPFTPNGDPYQPVTWIEQGVLKTLAYPRFVGPPGGRDPRGKPLSPIFHMHGGTTTIDEMIRTTERGLLVTRFWGVRLIEQYSILCTGVTRDGLWLIERGKISHPVTNLRFTESPLFVFNKIQQLGTSVPVFSPGAPAIVPPLKVTDFSFTSTIDAV